MYDIDAVTGMSSGDLQTIVKNRDNWRKLIMTITKNWPQHNGTGSLCFVYT